MISSMAFSNELSNSQQALSSLLHKYSIMTYFFNFLTFESTKKRDDFAIKVLILLLAIWMSLWLLPRYISSHNSSDIKIEHSEASIHTETNSSIHINESYLTQNSLLNNTVCVSGPYSSPDFDVPLDLYAK